MIIFLVLKKCVILFILSLNLLMICFLEFESNCLLLDINFLVFVLLNILKLDSFMSDVLLVFNILFFVLFIWVIERLLVCFIINILGSVLNIVCVKIFWFFMLDKFFIVYIYEIWFFGSKLMWSVKGKIFLFFWILFRVKCMLCVVLFFVVFFNFIRSGLWVCLEGFISLCMWMVWGEKLLRLNMFNVIGLVNLIMLVLLKVNMFFCIVFNIVL